MQVFAAKSPGNPANQLRTTVILRAKASSAVFEAVFTQHV